MSTLQLYGKLPANLFGGETEGESLRVDLLSDVIKVTLHTSAYVPNINTHEVYADLTNELPTSFGYSNGGITIGGKSIAYNATGRITTFDMDDTTVKVTTSGGDLVFRYAVFRDSSVATEPLIGYVDCGARTILAGNIVMITTDVNGVFQTVGT